MQAKLLGFRPLDFKSQDGNDIKGYSLFVAMEADGVTGLAAEKIFAKDGMIAADMLKAGAVYNLSFNMKGKLTAIEPAQQA